MRGRTVLTTDGVYDRLVGFDSRNVAVNSPNTPSPAIMFPITAIMYFFLDGKNAATCARVAEIFAGPVTRVQQTADPLPPGTGTQR